MQASPFERFYTVDDKTGCWLWHGAIDGGYGRFRRKRAHRISYEMANGPIPPGEQIHHKCARKQCVNPEHLLAVTPGEHSLIESRFSKQQGRVQEMHVAGATADEIAAALGCSNATVQRLVNPQYRAAQRQYKESRRDYYRERDRAYRQRMTDECDRCGGSCKKGTKVCAGCRSRHAGWRKNQIERLWREGLTLLEIAEALGTTKGAIGVRMAELRRAGADLPYRHRVKSGQFCG